jgi:CheY-like chemotaxis protein
MPEGGLIEVRAENLANGAKDTLPPREGEHKITEDKYMEGKYIEVKYTKDKYTKDKYTEGKYAEGKYTEGNYAEGKYAEGKYAEGEYIEGNYAEGKNIETRYIKISFRDHGVGIPEEYLPKIFDPYFTTKQKGSGLGLAVTYSIIKKHGGHIEVESKVGIGSAFFIYLPASKEESLAMKNDTEKSRLCTSQSRYAGKGKILFMDDQPNIRAMVGRMLIHLNYEVELARDGAEAIDLYKKAKESGHPFDAVMLDLTVPGGMGGKDAIQKLLEIDPDVKAIVSSGYFNDPIMSEYRQYGFCGVVAKPYEVEELTEILNQVLR